MPYNTILIPLDGSPDAVFACETAINLGSPDVSGKMLHLVHCVDPIPALIKGETRENLLQERKTKVDTVFVRAKGRLESHGFLCKTHVCEGDPGEEILRVCRKAGCDVIIMGTRGLGRLKSLLLGSVSRDVLKGATVPVILVRPS